MSELHNQILYREGVVSTFCRYLTTYGSVPFLFLHGSNGTGRMHSIQAFLSNTQLPYIVMNGRIDSEYGFLEQIINATSLLINALTSVNDAYVIPENCIPNEIKCRKFREFIDIFNPMVCFLRRICSKENQSPSLHIVISDTGELFTRVSPTFFTTLTRLNEILEESVSVILVSEVPWDHLNGLPGEPRSPVSIHFPSYAMEELHSLLVTLSAPNWTLSHGCSEQHCGELFAEFVRRFLDVLFLLTRNFERLEQLLGVCWRKALDEVAAGESLSDSQKLCALYTLFESDRRRFWKLLQPIFSRAYLTGDAQISGCSLSDLQHLIEQLVALPAAAKLLVVAAYIASYNPENTDRIYFEKESKAHLSGPHAFALTRLLHIYSELSREVGFEVPGDDCELRDVARSAPIRSTRDVRIRLPFAADSASSSGPHPDAPDELLDDNEADDTPSSVCASAVFASAHTLSLIGRLVELRLLDQLNSGRSSAKNKFVCLLVFEQVNNLAQYFANIYASLELDLRHYLNDFH